MTDIETRDNELHWDVFVTPGIPYETLDLPPGTQQRMWSPSATTSAVACLAAGRGFHRGCPASRTRPSEAHCLEFRCQSSVYLPFNHFERGSELIPTNGRHSIHRTPPQPDGCGWVPTGCSPPSRATVRGCFCFVVY